MQTMIHKTNHNIPILTWEEERATRIPITRLPPRRPTLARWFKPLGCPCLRKRFIFLNGPYPL